MRVPKPVPKPVPISNARPLIVALAALVAVAATARLGWWQLDRAAQKTAIEHSMRARATLPVLEARMLARSAEAASAQHHRTVLLRGQWQPEHTVYLENRQMFGRPGFYVVTPLLLSDGSAVLVQRGWQPRDSNERTRVREVPSPAGEVQVQGRIAPPPARLYEFDAAASGRIRQNLNLDAFARETGLKLLPLSVLQADATGTAAKAGPPATAAPSDGLKRDWPAPAADVHKHHGYAFQWFALSALVTGLYVWFQLIQPRRRARALARAR